MKRLFFLSMIALTVANTGCCRTWSQWWNRGASCGGDVCANGGAIEGQVFEGAAYGGEPYFDGVTEPETYDVLPSPAANRK